MKRDYTIDKILNDIKIKYKEKTGKDLTIDQLKNIVESQFAVPTAFETLEGIKLDYFGKFTIKEGRMDGLKTSKELKERGITGETRKEIIKSRGTKVGHLNVISFKSKEEVIDDKPKTFIPLTDTFSPDDFDL